MNNLGNYFMPIIIFIIILLALINNIPVFNVFISGAKEGIQTTFSIAPSLIGLITAISMLKASGALDIFTNLFSPVSNFLTIPSEVIPLALLRPISGSGSMALLNNILSTYTPDSNIGKIASIITGATETTFYTVAIYFGSIKIKNSRHAIPSALIGNIIAILMAVFTAKLF